MDGHTKPKPSGLKEWKPEQGAGYYVVGADGHIEAHVWQGHEHDLQTWSFGNCFQMYEEAAYAREKMQELFLQFHEDHGFRYSRVSKNAVFGLNFLPGFWTRQISWIMPILTGFGPNS